MDYGGATLAPLQPKWVGSHHNWTHSSDRVDAHRTGTDSYQVLPMLQSPEPVASASRPFEGGRLWRVGTCVEAVSTDLSLICVAQ